MAMCEKVTAGSAIKALQEAASKALQLTMAELKPCPFCGGTKLKVDSKKSNNTKWEGNIRFTSHVVTVRCNRCFTRGPATSVWLGGTCYGAVKHGEEAAIEAWNRRAEDVK